MAKPRKPKAGDSDNGSETKASRRASVTMPDSRAESIASDKTLNDGRPHIVRAVSMSVRKGKDDNVKTENKVFLPGQEEELAAVDGFADMKDRLTAKGAIVGF